MHGAQDRLAQEQAALRRVATMVAEGAEPASLFNVVAEQVSRILGVPLVSIVRFEDDGTATELASYSGHGAVFPVGRRWSLAGTNVLSSLRAGGAPARIDDYAGLEGEIADNVRRVGIRSTVGIPITVAGRMWGAIVVSGTGPEPLPADTEGRLTDFTELVATAIANAEARAEVQRLADEQAALRRVATLVANQVPATEVFAAVAEEVSRLFGGHATEINRYESDGTATCVAMVGVGTRRRTSMPGVQSAVAVPIVVDGRLWGTVGSGSQQPGGFPLDTESRMAEFAALIATAISNLQAREDLAASRARIVAAADNERRRVVRDLHDGAQQRLVHTLVTLKLADQAMATGEDDGPALVKEALDNIEQALAELRELARGILPSALTRGGLRAGIAALASRMPVPVRLGVAVDRLTPHIEATAYFVVAEALTNVAKHASAQQAEVIARVEDRTLRVAVRDDGVGGARVDGSGLVGLADRLAALDGRLEVDSPLGGGTRVAAAIPLS